MKTMRQILAKRWYLYLLMLVVVICVAVSLSAQEKQGGSGTAGQEKVESAPKPTPKATSDTKPESAKADEKKDASSTPEEKKEDPKTSKEQKSIWAWLRKYIWVAIAFILGIAFKEPLVNFFKNRFHPWVTRLFTRILIVCGGYNRPLKSYQRTLQRGLQKIRLTQQLFKEAVDLERNYIPIQLSKEEFAHPETVPLNEARHSGEITPHVTMRTDVRVAVNDVLKETHEGGGNRSVIIGDPGSGKTTLLNYLAYQCTKSEGIKQIPVLITLTTYVNSEAKNITAHIEEIFGENSFPKAKDYIEERLKAGNFLILFDGFDEVDIRRRKSLRNQLEAFAINEAYIRNTFVVTSRPIRDAVFDNFRHLEVMPLTAEQRKTFLESKIDDGEDSVFKADDCAELVKTIEGHDRIRKLAENPLLLTLLHHVYKYNLELPRRRVDLYRLSVELMLDWDIKTERPERIKVKDRDAKKEVLKKVAYYYHSNHTRFLPEEDLKAQVETNLPDSLRGKFTAEQLIEEVEISSGILRHRTAETFEFIHLTFQEYLAADYINDNRDEEIPKLITQLEDAWWREPTFLLAGIMRNATPLVQQILDYILRVSDDTEKLACLFIAFVCCTYEAEVDDEVSNQVFTAFTNLTHEQAAEVIQSIMGPIEEGNEEVKTLLRNLLNSTDENVQAWTLGFLDLLNSSDERVRVWGFGFLNLLYKIAPSISLPEHITAPDGAEMVLIPAGEFQMGTDNQEVPELVKWAKQYYPSESEANRFQKLVRRVRQYFRREKQYASGIDASFFEPETPRHTVNLKAFYIDVHPVTNAQYRQFIEATGHPVPEYWDDERFNQPNQPVVGVTWYDAMAYAQWAGKRLPTEAEWEKAARGGLEGKKYPWGDEEPDGTQCNFADKNTDFDWSDKTVDDGYQYTSPVGSFPPNSYGLCDMAGNVWEWCLDEYQEDFYKTSPQENPLAGGNLSELLTNYKDIKTVRVLRGGSWDGNPDGLRVAVRYRGEPDYGKYNIGFRCSSPCFP